MEKTTPTIKTTRKIGAEIAIAITIGVIALCFKSSEWANEWSISLLSQNFGLRQERSPHPDVLLVAVDEESYKLSGRISADRRFERSAFAKALKNIQQGNPRLIVIDAPFPEDWWDRSEDEDIWTLINGSKTTVIWSGKSAAEGFTLSDAIASGEPEEHSRRRLSARMSLPMALRLTQNMPIRIDAEQPNSYKTDGAFPWLRALIEVGGYSNLITPREGDLINYYGPRGTIPTVSLTSFFGEEGTVIPPFVEGKVVLIGYQSTYRQVCPMPETKISVPVSSRKSYMYGTEIHATIVSNLLDGSWLRRLSPLSENIVLFVGVVLIAFFTLVFYKNLYIIHALLGIALLSFLANYLAFLWGFFVTPIFCGILIALLALLAVSILKSWLSDYGARKVVEGIIAQKTFQDKQTRSHSSPE